MLKYIVTVFILIMTFLVMKEADASPKAAFCITAKPEITMLFRCIADPDKYIKIQPKKRLT